jgi:PAS domain S-box-containing protein
MTSTFDNAGKGMDVFSTREGSADAAALDPSYIRVARILEQSVNEIYLFDAETLFFEYVNEGGRRNLGYDMETLRRMTPLDIKPEFDEASFRAMIHPLLTGEKEILSFETTHLRADATLYPVEVRLQLDVQADKREFLAIILDITSRPTAQAALQESEKRFRTMIDTIPQLAWMAYANGTRYWFNQRWYDYTGTTPEQMENSGWTNVHDPEVLPRVIERWTAAIASGEAFDMEFPLRGKDGQFRIFLARAEPLRDAAGRVVQWFGTNTDVHEQRLWEKARRETERQLQVVMENMSEGVVIADLSGRLLQWNPAALKMHDISEESDVLTELEKLKDVYQLSTVEGVVVPVEEWPLRRVLRGESLHDLELRVSRADQSREGVFSYSGAISRYDEDKGLAFLIIKDITQRKNAEAALWDAKTNLEHKVNERTSQLLAKSKELENFCYSVSHDLRAPLRGIDGYSRLLLEDHHDSLSEEGRGFLTNVRAATRNMSALIEDLLAYSKLERRKLSTMAIRLSSFLANMLDLYKGEMEKVRITVEVDDLEVRADPDGLAIVLRNLIDNAVKFSQYVPQPEIGIRAHAAEDFCVLVVKDNGIGFDMKFYHKIFEIFHRLHRVEDYPGTGIGLAMVQKAMERMGGKVWAESHPGAGATFYLQLPLFNGAGRIGTENSPESLFNRQCPSL